MDGKFRARDVERILLLESDVNPKVRMILKELAERSHNHEKMIAECIGLVQMVVNQAEAFNMIASNMKDKLVQAQKNSTTAAPDLDIEQ